MRLLLPFEVVNYLEFILWRVCFFVANLVDTKANKKTMITVQKWIYFHIEYKTYNFCEKI